MSNASNKFRRRTHSRNIVTVETKPRDTAPKQANIAENLHTLRGVTHALLLCPGCGKTDTEPKLKVEGFDPHHPKCYQKMVREWEG